MTLRYFLLCVALFILAAVIIARSFLNFLLAMWGLS